MFRRYRRRTFQEVHEKLPRLRNRVDETRPTGERELAKLINVPVGDAARQSAKRTLRRRY